MVPTPLPAESFESSEAKRRGLSTLGKLRKVKSDLAVTSKAGEWQVPLLKCDS
jgi:hypothetical protein